MTIEKTDLQNNRRMPELTLTRNTPAQKMPENKFSVPVLTADPEMLLKMTESVKGLARMDPPKLANSVLTILQAESEQAAGDVTTDQQINHHTAKQVLLLAELTRLLGKSSESSILNNLNASIAQYEAIANSFTSVSDVYDGLVEDLKELEKQLRAAKEKYGKATEALENAKTQLESLEKELKKHNPGSQEYMDLTQQIKDQKSVVVDKTVEAGAAEKNYNTAAETALVMSVAVDKKLAELVAAYDELSFIQAAVHAETKESAIGKYVELIAIILNLIGKNNDATVEAQRKLNEMIHNERLSDIDKQAEEIRKKNKTSGFLKKFLGIFGAVFGVVLSIAGIIFSLPSAGASTALTIVGLMFASLSLALATADVIMGAVTGFDETVTSKISNWLAEQITGLMTKKTLEKIDRLSRENNADNNAEIARLKNLAENVYPVIASTISSIIMLIPAIGMMTCSIIGAVRGVAAAANGIQRAMTIAMIASAIGSLIQTTGSAGLNIGISYIQQQVAEVFAKMKLTQNDIEHVNQMTALLQEQIQKMSDQILDINKTVLNVLKSRMDAVHYSQHNLRNAGLHA